MNHVRSLLHRAGPWLVAGLAYLAMAVAVTWPLALELDRQVLGYLGFENTAQTIWHYHAWREFQGDLLRSNLQERGLLGTLANLGEIYRISVSFPEKNSMANGMDFVWTWPLDLLFGLPAYYNIKCWLILVANGLAGMALARATGARRLACWVGGAVFSFNPWTFHMLVTGRMVEAQTFLAAMAALALLWTWRRPEPWAWALAGGALALVTANYWFYGHFMILFTLVWLVWHLLIRRPPTLGPWGRNLVFYLLTFLVVCLPAAHPYLVRLVTNERLPGLVRPDPGDHPSLERLTRQATAFSAEADYPLRQPRRGIHRGFTPPWWLPNQHTFLANATLLALLPALLLRRGGFWLMGALVFYLLPLGPYLKFGGELVRIGGQPVPLPYLPLLLHFPLLEKLFWPNQSMFLFAMCVAILMAGNLDWLLRQARLKGVAALAVGATLVGVMALEMIGRGQLPLTRSEIVIPPLYQAEGRGRGFIYLPIGRRYWEVPRDFTFNRDYYHGSDLTLVNLHLAMHGGKGLFGRPHYMAGKDYWLYEPYHLSTQPFLCWLVALGEREPPSFEPQDLEQVLAEGYEYAVVHERFCSHLTDRGAYQLDLEEGRRRFDGIFKTMRQHFGAPVHEGLEPSWDQGGATPYEVSVQRFRVAIFRMSR